MNPTETIAASKTGIYLLNYGLFAGFNNSATYDILFFNKDGALYVKDKNIIYPAVPLPADVNGDKIIDIYDLTAVSKMLPLTVQQSSVMSVQIR